MQQINFYMVDAFTTTTFGGNAAAVCPLTDWLPDETLLKMAQQHNQSETAFFVANENGYELRWFTTQGEINLCGHATLAAAHVIFEHLDYPDTKIQFATRFVGPLTVTRCGEWLTLDFPAWPSESAVPPALLLETLGITEYKEVRVARDYMVVLKINSRLRLCAQTSTPCCRWGKWYASPRRVTGNTILSAVSFARVKPSRKTRSQARHIAC